MNEIIKLIQNHRSIRAYTEAAVTDDQLHQIIKSAQAMPNSINGQQVSVVVVKDKETKKKLAELCGNQQYVAIADVFLVFVADFYKANIAAQKNKTVQVIHDSAEGELVGILDCGIALGGACIAAESLGLGTVAIGGIRKNAAEVIKLLGLPQYTFPVNGLCIGHIKDHSAIKPRLPISSFAHNEKYNQEAIQPAIDAYDETMKTYYKNTGRGDNILRPFVKTNLPTL